MGVHDPDILRSRFEMSGVERLLQLEYTAAAGHRKMPTAYHSIEKESPMSTITRRQFLAGTSLAASAAALGGRFAWADQEVAVAPVKVKKGCDQVMLGDTGIQTSVLGIGTGTRGGREQRELGQEAFVRLAREAFDRGVRYIDTADMYKIHPFVGAALKQMPRDKVFVQTKTRAKTADAAKADIDRFRRELGIETLDTLLIHCMTKDQWPVDMRPVIDVLLDAKEKGQVRAIGVSCHTLDALADAADCEWMDVHLVRINPFGAKMDGEPDKVTPQIKKMHQKKRGVIGMKVFGEGSFKTPEERLKSLKFVLDMGAVHAFTIGFSSAGQIDETLKMIEQATA
jgi:predicted aldo/keto reductase-like oxidoreductase